MSLDPFTAFIDLVSMDQAVQTARSSLEQKKEYIARIAESLSVGQRAIKKIEDELHTYKKDADALQLELRSIDDRLAHVRKTLSNAGTPKEYFSLESEMKQLEQKQSGLEEKLFELLQAIDQTQPGLDQEQNKYKRASHAVNQEVAEAEKMCKSLENSIKESLQRIESLKPQVNPEVLERFLQMKQRIADPVVPVVDAACSGCGSAVLDRDVHALTRRTLVECRNCFRLLYLPSAV